MASTFKSLIDLIYPIGSIYLHTKTTNPINFLGGGDWAQIKGGLLACAGSSNIASLGTYGGNNTMTVDQMPSHDHAFQTDWSGAGWGGGYSPMGFLTINSGNDGNGGTLNPIYYTNIGVDIIHNTGGGQPFVPAHYAVNVWQRIK